MSDGPGRRSSLFDAQRSGTDVFAAARTGDETVGAALARVREANGLQVSDIAQHLRIRETFLVALEEGDLTRLPGSTYAIGFVRSYANLLGVDGEEAVALFKEQRAGEGNPATLVFPEPVAESRIPKGAILFISVLLAATAYGGWYYMSAHDMELADLVPEVPAALRGEAPDSQSAGATPERTVPPPETVPSPDGEAAREPVARPGDRMAAQAPESRTVPVPESPASMPESSAPAGQAATEQSPTEQPPAGTASSDPAVPAPDPETPAPGTSTAEAPAPETSIGDGEPAPAAEQRAAEPETARQEAPAAAPDADAGPSEEQAVAAPTAPTISNPRMVEAVPQPPPVESGSRPEGAASSAAETSGTPEGSRTGGAQVARGDATIELHAKSDSWVQIRGRDGRVVLMRILRTGDSYTVPDEAGLSLMTGNAGAIEITVDGETVPSIGPVGAVRRDVALDADRLRAGTAVGR